MNETELCLNNGTCVNTYGHWKCACAKGWTGVNCTVGELKSSIEISHLIFCRTC